MPLPAFAAQEARANAAVMSHLSNATASFAGQPPLPVIFERDYVEAEGMAASVPLIRLPSASVPGSVRGLRVTVQTQAGASHWRVAEHHPDGAGLSTLYLEHA